MLRERERERERERCLIGTIRVIIHGNRKMKEEEREYRSYGNRIMKKKKKEEREHRSLGLWKGKKINCFKSKFHIYN